MTEIIEGLGTPERERIAVLRGREAFFWVDIALQETSGDELGEALAIPGSLLSPLIDFRDDAPPSRKFHSDGKRVAFAASCFLEPAEAPAWSLQPLRPIEVRVLISGDFLLTVHEAPLSLPKLLAPEIPEGRSEQYVVYVILDAMVATGFDVLNEAELALESLQPTSTDMRASRVRMASPAGDQLAALEDEAPVGSQRGLFERISEEIGRIEGLEADRERYYERLYGQLNRLLAGIDAAGETLAKLINLRLIETTHWLTVVATIFLPLTFVTGFFGMNFGWMVDRIDTPLAFVLLGIGTPLLGVALTVLLVRPRGTAVEPDRGGAQTR